MTQIPKSPFTEGKLRHWSHGTPHHPAHEPRNGPDEYSPARPCWDKRGSGGQSREGRSTFGGV